MNARKISIHSLRMEGDAAQRRMRRYHRHFNPLPPHGGRRDTLEYAQKKLNISIHSLRMEGDLRKAFILTGEKHFNPLPPHGGRQQVIFFRRPVSHFNPLPPHGGRQNRTLPSGAATIFQSTPSAWRETAGVVQIVADLSISIHSLRMEGDSKTAQESVFHFAYPCTILQKRMQKTTFCTRKNGFFRKKGEKFGAKPSASFCAPMIRTDTFPLNFSHRISGSSMSMVSFAPICSTFD